MSYGDERSEARRLRSILEEGDRMTGPKPYDPNDPSWRMDVTDEEWAAFDKARAEAATPTVEQSGPLDAAIHQRTIHQKSTTQQYRDGWNDALRQILHDRDAAGDDPCEGHGEDDFAAEYARLVPQPTRPADTALRERLADMVLNFDAAKWSQNRSQKRAWEAARAALAEQPTSSEQDRP